MAAPTASSGRRVSTSTRLTAEIAAKASPRLWALAAFRLLILPIVLWLLLKWTGVGTPLVANIAVILMAMPTALNGSMLAMEYGGDTECMAQSIFLTTLMSIITIPVLAALL